MNAAMMVLALAASPCISEMPGGYVSPRLSERPPGHCVSGYYYCLHRYPAFQEAQYRRGFNYRVIMDYPWYQHPATWPAKSCRCSTPLPMLAPIEELESVLPGEVEPIEPGDEPIVEPTSVQRRAVNAADDASNTTDDASTGAARNERRALSSAFSVPRSAARPAPRIAERPAKAATGLVSPPVPRRGVRPTLGMRPLPMPCDDGNCAPCASVRICSPLLPDAYWCPPVPRIVHIDSPQ